MIDPLIDVAKYVLCDITIVSKRRYLMRLFILFWRRLGGVKDGFCFLCNSLLKIRVEIRLELDFAGGVSLRIYIQVGGQ